MSEILNFGASTILFNDVDLGATTDGGSITPRVNILEDTDILGYSKHYEQLLGGEGSINFFKWSSDLSLEEDIGLTTWGVLKIDSSKMNITLWYCKLFLDFETSFGKLEQSPFKVKFVFSKEPSSGKIMDIGGI